MALKFSGKFLRFNSVNGRFLQATSVRWNTGAANYLNYEKDPAPEFFNPQTQKLLSSITQLQLEKIFKKRTVRNNTPQYKFLTDNQLEEEVRSKFKHAKELLQMPPVLMVKKDENKIYSHDPALTNFSSADWVFTDVTYGLTNEERLVVIRTTDGTLKEAPFEVKKRCWQIYFPMENRSFREPKMFEADNMKRLLNEQEYVFILDRACTQYDPYEQKFHDISSKVYLHIDENLHFDVLRSTRHFGPMAFFFAWHKMIDNLLLDMIRNDYLKNGVQLISLMYQLNGIAESTDILKNFNTDREVEEQIQSTIKSLLSKEESSVKKVDKSRHDLQMDEICFEYIQNYVAKYSLKKPQLELTLQTYKEWHNELKTMGVRAN